MTALFPMEPGHFLRILLDRGHQPGPTDGTVTLVSISVPRWRGIANLCIWLCAAAMSHVLDQGPDLEHLQRWDPGCHPPQTVPLSCLLRAQGSPSPSKRCPSESW